MNLVLLFLSGIMLVEHAIIGTNALVKKETVSRTTGIPLAFFEMFYYVILAVLFPSILLVYFFLFTHVVGGLYYVLKGERSYGKQFYVGYSIFEYVELLFIVYIVYLALTLP
ncbi:MAG: hypothetical protein OWQ54_09215 [Sulfolobaceae archaeon]|nr:hypothetical protein [Sulfolobaceae archaeon]